MGVNYPTFTTVVAEVGILLRNFDKLEFIDAKSSQKYDNKKG